jgi:hypothetical protein
MSGYCCFKIERYSQLIEQDLDFFCTIFVGQAIILISDFLA